MRTFITAIAVLLASAAFLSAGNVQIPEAGGWTPPVDGMTYFDATP